VRHAQQIGFHLSATVADGERTGDIPPVATPPDHRATTTSSDYRVAITIDRCKIAHCECSVCTGSWCAHVVAVCLHRMAGSDRRVDFRVPISESLDRLDRADHPIGDDHCDKCEARTTTPTIAFGATANNRRQLKKFAQYFISELPREYLPVAQRLLDELLTRDSEISRSCGAPDPTAGAAGDAMASWCMDEEALSTNIRRILTKFCVPSPTVFSDVSCLSSQQPQVASEWQSLIRPLRSLEPEGLCNLLSIVGEMLKRNDPNATNLLHIITDKCLGYTQVRSNYSNPNWAGDHLVVQHSTGAIGALSRHWRGRRLLVVVGLEVGCVARIRLIFRLIDV